jgi:hypothetical protein
MAKRSASTPSTGGHDPARHFTLEYIGFRNAGDRREYILRARFGTDARDYTLWIAHAAFAARQALLQDGPDICFQKLWRELAVVESRSVTCVAVTEADLASYREAHAPPARRLPTPRPASTSPNAWTSAPSPRPRDGRR